MGMAESLSQHQVRFESGSDSIAGLLTVPDGVEGPVPAVAFVAGSGSSTRDGSGLYPPIFEEFAKHGIASFSWDKPGVGDSTGDFKTQSFTDRADEVVAAVELLKTRDDIDSSRIGMWGISQAGWVMPQVCHLAPDVAFMIAVSVPVSTVNEQNIYRVRTTFPADGFTPEETDRAVGLFRKLESLIEADAPVEDVKEAFAEYENERWVKVAVGDTEDFAGYDFLKQIATFDVRPFLRKVGCPVLGIFGEKDTIVDVEESMAGYRSLLAEAGNGDVTLRTFPDANHSIALAKTGSQMEAVKMAETGERVFAPGYVELMGDWLAERT